MILIHIDAAFKSAVYIYIYIYIYIDIDIDIDIYKKHIHKHIHRHLYKHIHIHRHTHTHRPRPRPRPRHRHRRMHACMHACMYCCDGSQTCTRPPACDIACRTRGHTTRETLDVWKKSRHKLAQRTISFVTKFNDQCSYVTTYTLTEPKLQLGIHLASKFDGLACLKAER